MSERAEEEKMMGGSVVRFAVPADMRYRELRSEARVRRIPILNSGAFPARAKVNDAKCQDRCCHHQITRSFPPSTS